MREQCFRTGGGATVEASEEDSGVSGTLMVRVGAGRGELNRIPPGVLAGSSFDDDLRDVLERHLYVPQSAYLAAMGESALYRMKDQGPEIYRFLWLRTWHKPIAIRIENMGDINTVVVKQLDGMGGYTTPRALIVYRRLAIGIDEWNAFTRLLDRANYWTLASTRKSAAGGYGSRWILEGVKDGHYRIVVRWSPHESYSPEEELRFRDACLYLLEISGLEVRRVY